MRCKDCGTEYGETEEKYPEGGYHDPRFCIGNLKRKLLAERKLSEAFEDMMGLLSVAEHAQEYEEIEKCRLRIVNLRAARKRA
jgi:hypothetical protein